MGNLTRDPEVRYTPKGTPVCDVGMAINTTYKTQDGHDREEVTYVTVETWGRQAETCGQYLSKGTPIFVEGRLQLDQWDDKDGKKVSRLKVRADRVQFLGRPKNAEFKDGGERSPERSQSGERPQRPPQKPQRSEPPSDEPTQSAVDEDDIPF